MPQLLDDSLPVRLHDEWCVLFEDGTRMSFQRETALKVYTRARANGRDVHVCHRYTTEWEVEQ